jgi:hypothetical protein
MKMMLKLVSLSILTLTAFAQVEDGVPPGLDLWHTAGDGNTFYSMKDSPIPAGFFCEDSEAFSGSLDFDGVPIKTEPEGALGKIDTIIERLDFAPYDQNGLAYTRLVARALNLKSRAPIENECGTWDVFVTLAKTQPVTEGNFIRDEFDKGRFSLDLVLNFRMVFTLRGQEEIQRELVRTIHFSKFLEIPYTVHVRTETVSPNKWAPNNEITFDSNGDGKPDMTYPSMDAQTYETFATLGDRPLQADKIAPTLQILPTGAYCHVYENDHMHCVYP